MLINTFESKEPRFEDIVGIIEKDVAFSYEILKIANTVHYYRGNRIKSIRQAAVRMGLTELKKWAMITVLRKIDENNQDEIVSYSVQRAKALEPICQKIGLDDRIMEFFTLGILSMIDVLTGCPMDLIVAELSVSEEVRRLLIGNCNDGVMSVCYKRVLAYEKGEWDQTVVFAQKLALNVEAVAKAYFEAIVWLSDY